jgi:toxin-antitoxin system PIN domain toxin
VDANLLVYAHVSDFPEHERARSWLDASLNDMPRVGFAWPSLVAFLRLTTNGRVFSNPEPIEAARAQVTSWLAAPSAWTRAPTARHESVLGGLIEAARPVANLVPDADLAALAIEHGLTLCSTDRDFARFPGLRWENPIS